MSRPGMSFAGLAGRIVSLMLVPQVWPHLLRAIHAYRDDARRNFRKVPTELGHLEHLLANATESVRARQGTTPVDPAPPTGDAAPVLLHKFDDAAEALSVSRRTLERMVERGDLAAVQVTGGRRIHTDELERYARNGAA